MKPVSSKLFWQTFIWSSILLSVSAIYQTAQQISASGYYSLAFQMDYSAGLVCVEYCCRRVLRFGNYLLIAARSWIEKLEFTPKNISAKLFGFILVLFGFSLVWAVRLTFFGNILPQLTPIFWVFLWASLLQTLGLKLITGYKWHFLFALTVLVQGLIYQIYGHLTIVTDYPFSIGYSEAGRHYYASLFYAKSLYDITVAASVFAPDTLFFDVTSLPV